MAETGVWREAMQLFDEWLQAAPDEGQALLDRVAAEDPAIHRRLRSLIDADGAASEKDFLSPPPSFGGQRLGAWVLHESLGRGGMGEVWRATRDDGLYQGQAAVKLLHAGRAGPVAAARFAREGELLGRLRHPHIAQLLDAGFAPGGQRYLVLEYVAGERIDSWCEARSLDVDARLALFGQVCEAVSFAHTHLVIHRDLKPGNILVSEIGKEGGHVKLLDFGVAKLLGDTEEAELSREAAAGLTPEYAAPEQVQGEPVSTATDVYALGVLLFTLLGGGARPYSASTPAALARAIVESEPQRLSEAAESPELKRRLQGDLDIIVAKAMKKRPEERYPTVQALHDDLLRHLNDEPVSAQPDGWRYRSAKFVRRHRGPVFATVALLFSLLAGIAATTWQWRAATLEAQRTRTVVKMLADTFTPLAPDESGKAQVPVVELLRKGWSEAKTKFANDPALLAEVARPLGLLMKSSGEMAMAAEALGLAHAQMLSQGQNNTPAFLEVTLELGNAHHRLGQNDAARLRFQEVVDSAATRAGPLPAEVINAQTLLANIERERGRLPQARSLLEAAATATLRQFGSTDPRYALALQTLHEVAVEQGRWDEARELLARVEQSLQGANPAETHAARLYRATFDVELGQYREAAARLGPLAEDMRRLYGADDTHTIYTETWLAIALFHLGEAAASDAAAERALSSARRSTETDVRHEVRLVRARHLIRRAQCPSALPLLRESLAYFEAGDASHRPFAERARMLLGECQLRSRQTAQGIATLTETRERQRAHYGGARHLDLWPTQWLLALAHADAGQPSQALREAQEAQAIAQALLPPRHPDRARIQALLAQLKWRLEPGADSARQLHQALAGYAQALSGRADSAANSVLLLDKLPAAGPAAASRSDDPRFTLFNF